MGKQTSEQVAANEELTRKVENMVSVHPNIVSNIWKLSAKVALVVKVTYANPANNCVFLGGTEDYLNLPPRLPRDFWARLTCHSVSGLVQ